MLTSFRLVLCIGMLALNSELELSFRFVSALCLLDLCFSVHDSDMVTINMTTAISIVNVIRIYATGFALFPSGFVLSLLICIDDVDVDGPSAMVLYALLLV